MSTPTLQLVYCIATLILLLDGYSIIHDDWHRTCVHV